MKILMDLDCYFVSAERTINPKLIGKCVAVGGLSDLHIFSKKESKQKDLITLTPQAKLHKPKNNYLIDLNGKIRGILTAVSYEARAMGVKAPMPIALALQLCPKLIILPPTFKLYHELSKNLKSYLQKRLPLLEQFSIDEFFADLSGWVQDDDVPAFIHNLKEEIMHEFNLPLSIGASNSKWIAKLSASLAKPYGTKVVWANKHYDTVKDISIKKFPGIGKKLQKRFYEIGFYTLGDIINAKEYFYKLTPFMKTLWKRINGTDNENIKLLKQRQSIGISRTFDALMSRKELKRRLTILSRHLVFIVFQTKVNPTSFHLFIRYELQTHTKGNISNRRLFSEQLFKFEILKLFNKIDKFPTYHIIHISLSVSRFSHQTKQSLDMFSIEKDSQNVILSKIIFKIRKKYSIDILRWGNEIEN